MNWSAILFYTVRYVSNLYPGLLNRLYNIPNRSYSELISSTSSVIHIGGGFFSGVFEIRKGKRMEKDIVKVSKSKSSERIHFPLYYAHEIRAHGMVNNIPCVPKMKDFWSTDIREEGCILMEHVGEYDFLFLAYYLPIRKIVNSHLKFIVAEMVAALIAIHERGIVHRDIKLANFILSWDGHVKLIDFGISHIKPRKQNNIGSYVDLCIREPWRLFGCFNGANHAPEQGKVHHWHDIMAMDWYSLGIVINGLVLGKEPEQPKSKTEKLVLRFPRETDVELVSLVKGLTAYRTNRLGDHSKEKLKELLEHEYFGKNFDWEPFLNFTANAPLDLVKIGSTPFLKQRFLHLKSE